MYNPYVKSDELKNKKIGHFKLLRVLGEGGMGCVFEAIDCRTRKKVALKLLLDATNSTSAQLEQACRLRDEASIALRLRHPALVEVLDCGESKEFGPFIVFALLSGASLRDELNDRKKIPFCELFERIIKPILSALSVLHGAGVVHRDIKPENLFISGDGNYMLGDLGLARFEGREAKTKTGLIVGTPAYISPEQLLSPDTPATPASDLYSFGLVVVEALTGRTFMESMGKATTLYERLYSAPPLHSVNKDLRGELRQLLSPDPRKRQSDIIELLDVFEQKANGLRKEKREPRSLLFYTLVTVVLLLCFWICTEQYFLRNNKPKYGPVALDKAIVSFRLGERVLSKKVFYSYAAHANEPHKSRARLYLALLKGFRIPHNIKMSSLRKLEVTLVKLLEADRKKADELCEIVSDKEKVKWFKDIAGWRALIKVGIVLYNSWYYDCAKGSERQKELRDSAIIVMKHVALEAKDLDLRTEACELWITIVKRDNRVAFERAKFLDVLGELKNSPRYNELRKSLMEVTTIRVRNELENRFNLH